MDTPLAADALPALPTSPLKAAPSLELPVFALSPNETSGMPSDQAIAGPGPGGEGMQEPEPAAALAGEPRYSSAAEDEPGLAPPPEVAAAAAAAEGEERSGSRDSVLLGGGAAAAEAPGALLAGEAELDGEMAETMEGAT